MTWQQIAGLAGFTLTSVNLINLFLNNKTRADVAELKLLMAEGRAKDRDELKAWAKDEFQSSDVAEARFETLKTQIAALR